MIRKFAVLMLIIFALTGCIQDPADPDDHRRAPSGPPTPFDKIIIPAIDPPSTHPEACKKKTAGTFLSNLFYFLLDPISNQVMSISLIIFNNFLSNPAFSNIISILLVLYMIVYGIMFASNMIDATATDLVKRLVKIGIVLTLTRQAGTYTFFNEHLFQLFTTGSYQLIQTIVDPGHCSDKINFFAPVDYVVSNLTNKNMALRLTAMLFAFPIGWLCFPLFVLSILQYLLAILKAIIAYLIAFTAVAFLIALGPMFIILLLFGPTRSLFDNWLKLLVTFAFQPVLMFAGIYIVSAFVNQLLYNILGECTWARFLSLRLYITNDIQYHFFDVYWFMPEWWSLDLNAKSTDGFTSVYDRYLVFLADLITFYLCTRLLSKIPEFVETIATFLFSGGGLTGGEGGEGGLKGATDIASGIVNTPKSLLGMDKKDKEGEKKKRAEVRVASFKNR